MFENIIPTNSILLFRFQGFSEEILSIFPKVLINNQRLIHDWLDKFILWLGHPGCFTMKHLIENTSHGPYITFGSISHTFEHFHRHVQWSANATLIFNIFMDIGFGKPKICNFEFSFVHKDIRWFKVPT